MLDLMAVSHNDGPMPLYLHTVYRILRDMRIAQQETGIGFSYAEFKRQINDTPMTPAQLGPLTQRLDTLESFMPRSETEIFSKQKRKILDKSGTDWTNKVLISPPTSCSSNLTGLGRLPYYCRPFLPLCYPRGRLFSLQYMFEYLLRA
jgi:hypothetical protein